LRLDAEVLDRLAPECVLLPHERGELLGRAAVSTPALPEAPGRLFATPSWLNVSASLGCRMRPMKSDTPPGANRMIVRRGRDDV
jgi:hypothetical protein